MSTIKTDIDAGIDSVQLNIETGQRLRDMLTGGVLVQDMSILVSAPSGGQILSRLEQNEIGYTVLSYGGAAAVQDPFVDVSLRYPIAQSNQSADIKNNGISPYMTDIPYDPQFKCGTLEQALRMEGEEVGQNLIIVLKDGKYKTSAPVSKGTVREDGRVEFKNTSGSPFVKDPSDILSIHRLGTAQILYPGDQSGAEYQVRERYGEAKGIQVTDDKDLKDSLGVYFARYQTLEITYKDASNQISHARIMFLSAQDGVMANNYEKKKPFIFGVNADNQLQAIPITDIFCVKGLVPDSFPTSAKINGKQVDSYRIGSPLFEAE